MLNLKEDEEYGGQKSTTITKDFMWSWQQINDRMFMMLNMLLERIRSMGIFEKLKELNIFDNDISDLQDRISRATTKSELSDKGISNIVQQSHDDYDSD